MTDQLFHILYLIFGWLVAGYTGWLIGRIGLRGLWRVIVGWWKESIRLIGEYSRAMFLFWRSK